MFKMNTTILYHKNIEFCIIYIVFNIKMIILIINMNNNDCIIIKQTKYNSNNNKNILLYITLIY